MDAESKKKAVLLHLIRDLYRITTMEDNKTKYIESSLAAFRAIKSFVFQKGAYPGNFDNGTWKEEDYDDPDYRRVMREDFDDYIRLLSIIRKQYAEALCNAIPHIESEYDNLVIRSSCGRLP